MLSLRYMCSESILFFMNMKINCAIVDDNSESVETLREYVSKITYLNLIGGYTDAVDAMKGFRNNTIDLLFLVIRMQRLSGLELAKMLPKTTKIVFVTAFTEYAIDGYKSGGFDYLLKPVNFNNFEACVERVKKYMCDVDEADPIRRDGYIFVKSDHKYVRVNFDDILFVKCIKEYVMFCLNNKPNVITLMNMRQLEDQLPKKKFKRIHRSYIANFDLFDYTDKDRLYYGETSIPISESYKNVVMDFVEKHTL